MNDDQLSELADLMVWGVADGFECDQRWFQPFEPLPVWAAASFMGLRRHRARVAMTSPTFRRLFSSRLEAMRNGERARNVAVAIRIRDQELQAESAADRTVKLKAIASIEGREAPELTVTLNQTNVIAPGYVIRLPANAASPEPLTIDATPLPEGDA